MNKIYTFIILISSVLTTLSSEEAGSTSSFEQSVIEQPTIPDPENLSTNWWDYFNLSGPELDDHAKTFIEYLDEVEKDPLNKNSEVYSIITVIKRILHGMVNPQQNYKLPLLPNFEKQNAYTVKEFVDLKMNLEVTRKILKENKSLLAEEKRRYDELLTHLDTLVQKYPRVAKDSRARLKAGLTIILYQLSCKLSEQNISQINTAIDQSSDVIDTVRRTIDYASNKLSSSPQEIRELEMEAEKAKKDWQDAVDTLRRKELYQTSDHNENDDKNSQSAKLLFNQELCSLHVQEALKRIKYEFLDLLMILSEFVHSPEALKTSSLQDTLRLVYEDISNVLERSSDWLENSQSGLIAASGSLFLLTDEPQSKQSNSPELVENYKKIISTSEQTITQIEDLNQLLISTKFLNDFLFNKLIAESGFFHNYSERIQFQLRELYDDLTYYYDITLFHIGTKPVTLHELTQAFIVFGLAFILARILRKISAKLLARKQHANVHIIYRVDRVVQYFILTAGFLIALSMIGYDLTNLVIIAGALGVGLGFGLQTIFNNFICGLIILFENQLKVGDFVQLETGLEGQITEIKSHSTFIRNADGVEIIVPNADLINQKLINWTLSDLYRRTHIPFTVAYDTDLKKVKELVLEIAYKNPSTVANESDLKPDLWLCCFGATGLDMELIVWTNVRDTEQEKACISSYLWEIEKIFRQEKIDIPCMVKELCIMTNDANRQK